MSDSRAVKVLLGALGGEGGTSIAKWIVEAAQLEGLLVQSTSIPGVAQRTGATTYYIEIVPHERLGRAPVFALAPSPGAVDVVLASEQVEAGRALQNGFVSPQRTTLVMSSHRVFAVAEKAAMGDGRYTAERIDHAASALAKTLIAFDMATLARQHGVPITVVLLGAAAATLPISRTSFERVISGSQKGAEASLRGFAAGWAAARIEPAAAAAQHLEPRRPARSPAQPFEEFVEPVRHLLEQGVRRLIDYQDDAYADLFLARIRAVAELDRQHGGQSRGYALTIAAARYTALWMSYEDAARVAEMKTRLDRLDQVRRESGARPGQPIRVFEFLKPGVDEICAVLPTGLAAPLRRFVDRRGWGRRLNVGMRIRTNGLPGFLVLRALASLRKVRRFSSRWSLEQQQIEQWLSVVCGAARLDLDLAGEIAECGRLVKGYGDTHRRAVSNFDRILSMAREGLHGGADLARLAGVVRQARDAALADPDGTALDLVLSAHAQGNAAPRSRAPIMLRAAGHG